MSEPERPTDIVERLQRHSDAVDAMPTGAEPFDQWSNDRLCTHLNHIAIEQDDANAGAIILAASHRLSGAPSAGGEPSEPTERIDGTITMEEILPGGRRTITITSDKPWPDDEPVTLYVVRARREPSEEVE